MPTPPCPMRLDVSASMAQRDDARTLLPCAPRGPPHDDVPQRRRPGRAAPHTAAVRVRRGARCRWRRRRAQAARPPALAVLCAPLASIWAPAPSRFLLPGGFHNDASQRQTQTQTRTRGLKPCDGVMPTQRHGTTLGVGRGVPGRNGGTSHMERPLRTPPGGVLCGRPRERAYAMGVVDPANCARTMQRRGHAPAPHAEVRHRLLPGVRNGPPRNRVPVTLRGVDRPGNGRGQPPRRSAKSGDGPDAPLSQRAASDNLRKWPSARHHPKTRATQSSRCAGRTRRKQRSCPRWTSGASPPLVARSCWAKQGVVSRPDPDAFRPNLPPHPGPLRAPLGA